MIKQDLQEKGSWNVWPHLIYKVQIFKGLNQQVQSLGIVQEELNKINNPMIYENFMTAIQRLLECNVQISEVWKHQIRI